MAESSPGRFLRWLAVLLVRGSNASFLLGDLDESLQRDVERGLSLRRARWRYATNVLGSALALLRARVRLAFPASKRLYGQGPVLWLEQLQQDVRYAGRSLRRTPVFAIAAILTLGLGIGANTALFTVTRGVLLKTLPVERPEQLVEIGCVNPDNPNDACRTHYPGFLMFGENTDVLSGVFAFASASDLAVNIGGRSEVVEGLMVSANSFSVLGLAPYAGRLFSPADDEAGAPLVAVLSHQFWQRRLGNDPAVIGRPLRLNNRVVTIIGVTPPAFRGLTVGSAPDVMLPIGSADTFRRPGSLQARAAWWVYIMGRLQPGVTAEQAQAALDPTFRGTLQMTIDALPADAAAGFRDFVDDFRFRISPAATGGISRFRRMLEQPLRILWGVVALVLLITCANLAGLLLSRAIDRRREFGIRLALGVGRARLVRQVFTEAVVLAFIGGAIGLVIAGWVASSALALGAGETGVRAVDVRPDLTVLAFTAIVSSVTGLALGLGSVWRAATTAPSEAWRASLLHRSRVPLARTLVAGQVALTMVLLSVAVLFVKSLANARGVDPGFDSENLITLTVAPGTSGDRPDDAMGYLRRVLAAAEAVPGVRAATYHYVPIATGLVSQTTASVPGFAGPSDQTVTGQNRVGPRFAETLGLKLIGGRDLSRRDEATSPRGALVNERFARHFFQSSDVIGKTFLLGQQEYAIVGVVADAHDRSVVRPTENWVYTPVEDPEPQMRVTIRASDGVLPVAAGLERALQAIDPSVPVFGVRPVSAQIDETLRRERLLATLGAAFGALALGLVAIGVYALFSGLVSRRTREIGIRIAVGADAGQIARLLAREASVVAFCGLAVGIVGAIAAGSVIRNQLFNVEPTDARSFVASAAVLIVATAIAVAVPAWRAIAIQPAETLRGD